MITDEDVKAGDHCWAMMDGELLVILKTNNGYEVCGAWECGVSSKDIEIISVISKPNMYKENKLYYAD